MGLRDRLAAVRMCCERNAMARFGGGAPSARPRVLCYHSVGTSRWGVNDVEPRRFRRQLELALEAGYHFLRADDIVRTGGRPGELAITFDDGLATVATNALPILRELGIPATLFVVSDWAEGRHPFGGKDLMLGWRDVELLAQHDFSIGSHSVTHPNFGHLSPTQTDYELGESRRMIEARTGIRATEFAIPFGQSTDWTSHAAAAAASVGYTTVYAQSETHRPQGSVPRTFITRFDGDAIFRAALEGTFDAWEEWR